MNNLNGFDLVYALTAKTINSQLQLLYITGVLPTSWNYDYNQGEASIAATLGMPSVDLITGDASSRQMDIYFPLTDPSSMTVSAIGRDEHGKLTVVPKTTDVGGWQLKLRVNLSLADIAQKALQAHKLIPKEVKNQLQHFTEDMYDISHLFLDFEDADLVERYELIPPKGQNADAFNSPAVIDQLKSLIQSLLNAHKGSDNPFIIGYTVADKRPPTVNADFVPTGTTYSIYPEVTDPGRSTINFLSVTAGRVVPGGNHGLFTHNWVADNNVQGAFVVAQYLLMSKLLPPIAKIMGASVGAFTSNGATVSLSMPNDRGGIISVSIKPVVNQPRIEADFLSTFLQNVHDRAGSGIGYVSGWLKWTTTISLGFDKNNNLSVSVANSATQHYSENHPNALGKFEQILAVFADAVLKALTFGQAPDVFENLTKGDWDVHVNADLSVISADMRSRLVLPAGSEFFFKDARMSQEGHLVMTTTIKN